MMIMTLSMAVSEEGGDEHEIRERFRWSSPDVSLSMVILPWSRGIPSIMAYLSQPTSLAPSRPPPGHSSRGSDSGRSPLTSLVLSERGGERGWCRAGLLERVSLEPHSCRPVPHHHDPARLCAFTFPFDLCLWWFIRPFGSSHCIVKASQLLIDTLSPFIHPSLPPCLTTLLGILIKS